jgi:hypothetical protein
MVKVRKRIPCHVLLDHRFLGGVLIMGQHSRSEALFYYFRLEHQVPESHLLRLIEKHNQLCVCTRKAEGQR